jgi:hypothetical protein
MEFSGIGAGLAALAFWGFIAAVVVAGIWYDIRKREAQHETVRRLVESGQPIDQELMEKLSLVADSGEKRHDQDFRLTGLWLLPVAVGMAVFGLILGSQYSEALAPLLGVAALLACMGIGFLMSARIAGRWYSKDSD